MSTYTKEYHPDDVDVIVDGRVLSSIQSDIVFSAQEHVSLQEDRYGNSTWTVQKIKSGDIAFSLLFGSPDNRVLSDLVEADLKDGSGAFSFSVRNNRGEDLLRAKSARVMQRAGLNYGQSESQPVEWNIKMAGVEMVIGSSDSTSV